MLLQGRKISWNVFTLVTLERGIQQLFWDLWWRLHVFTINFNFLNNQTWFNEVICVETVPVFLVFETGRDEVSGDDVDVHLGHGGDGMVSNVELRLLIPKCQFSRFRIHFFEQTDVSTIDVLQFWYTLSWQDQEVVFGFWIFVPDYHQWVCWVHDVFWVFHGSKKTFAPVSGFLRWTCNIRHLFFLFSTAPVSQKLELMQALQKLNSITCWTKRCIELTNNAKQSYTWCDGHRLPPPELLATDHRVVGPPLGDGHPGVPGLCDLYMCPADHSRDLTMCPRDLYMCSADPGVGDPGEGAPAQSHPGYQGDVRTRALTTPEIISSIGVIGHFSLCQSISILSPPTRTTTNALLCVEKLKKF